jgi:hypothetical protein
MNTPTFGGAPSERTDIRVAWDGEYLYAAGRFWDADPTGVRVNSLQRDEDVWRDDAFTLVLDTFDDDQTAAVFITTPAGLRKDFAAYNDAEPSWETPYDTSWNTLWDAAALRTPEGWFAELRIPLSSLRFEVRQGQVAGWDLGFFDLQTQASRALPAENFAVLRLQRQVLNPRSTAGGILTRRAGGGNRNLNRGLDAALELRPDQFATLKWVQTLDDTADPLRAGYLLARWERRTFQGLGYVVGAARSGAGYHPEMGFAPRSDYRRAEGRLSWGWTPAESSPFQTHLLALRGEAYLHNRGGLESASLGPAWDLAFKSGAYGQVTLDLLAEDLEEDFALSDRAWVAAGSYAFWAFNAYYQSPYGSRLRRDFSLAAGGFYDGWHLTLGATPSWSASRHLEVKPEYQFDLARFPERDQHFRSHLFRLRTRLAFDTRLSASALVQSASEEDAVGLNARLRYNRREGDDFHLVCDQGLNTDWDRLRPRLPRTAGRNLLAKYTRTFAY